MKYFYNSKNHFMGKTKQKEQKKQQQKQKTKKNHFMIALFIVNLFYFCIMQWDGKVLTRCSQSTPWLHDMKDLF